MKIASIISVACPGLLVATMSLAQIITTVAGTGTPGYSGDGGQATAARLYGPQGVAVDAAGNIYIADSVNNCVRKVSAITGIIAPVAGICGSAGAYGGDGGPATSANLNYPFNLFIDAAGNLFITEFWNHTVRKVDSSGFITTIAGTGATPCNPSPFSTCGDGGPATAALLAYPSGLAVDDVGNVYIGDHGDRAIRKVSASGIISTLAGDPLHYAAGSSGDGGPAQSSLIGAPHGLALDSGWNLYFADEAYYVVRKIAHGSTIISRVAGTYSLPPGYSGDGGPATSAQLSQPTGVAMDGAGNLYISDIDNCRIRKVSANTISLFAGTGNYGYSGDNGAATSAELKNPWQLAADVCGNVYIADAGASVVRKVANGSAAVLNPSITPVAPMCNGANVAATGHYTGAAAPDGYSWQLQSCTPSGVVTSAYNSGVLTFAGAPSPTAFNFPNTAGLPCNQNYLLTFTVTKRCPVPVTATVTKQIYLNCGPTPIITGNTTSCNGSPVTLCTNYHAPYDDEWYFHQGNLSVDLQGKCITVSPTTTTTYGLSVTDPATGCRGNASVVVTAARNNPDFTYQATYTSPNNFFTVAATPLPPYTNGVAGFGDLWTLEQLDSSGHSIPGTNTSTGTLPNPPCWWGIYPGAVPFFGFDGTKSSGINNVTCPSLAPGKFALGGTYRITHGIWNGICPWAQASHTVTVSGN